MTSTDAGDATMIAPGVGQGDATVVSEAAGDAAHYHPTGSSEPTGTTMTTGGTLALESGVSDEIRRELARRGHRIVDRVGYFGGYQAVMRDPETGVYAGATESRKDGCAMGY